MQMLLYVCMPLFYTTIGAYVCHSSILLRELIRQHTSAYVSIRQHTSICVYTTLLYYYRSMAMLMLLYVYAHASICVHTTLLYYYRSLATDLTRLIDNANAPILGTDLEGRVTSWNRRCHRITGLSFQEVSSKKKSRPPCAL